LISLVFIAQKKYNALAVRLPKIIDVDEENDVKEAENFLSAMK
jgi:hypothetical protein